MGPPSPVLIRWLPAPPLLLLLLCGRGTRPLPSHLPFWQASSIAGPYPCPPLGKHQVIRESCSRRESGLFHTDAACLVHCLRNKLNLCIKTEPIAVGADAMVQYMSVFWARYYVSSYDRLGFSSVYCCDIVRLLIKHAFHGAGFCKRWQTRYRATRKWTFVLSHPSFFSKILVFKFQIQYHE